MQRELIRKRRRQRIRTQRAQRRAGIRAVFSGFIEEYFRGLPILDRVFPMLRVPPDFTPPRSLSHLLSPKGPK